MANLTAKYTLLKRKYNQKEEENLSLREKIREFECNRCNNNGISQAIVTRLEMDRDAAKGDCARLREENNALRDDIQRLKENQHSDGVSLEQARQDYERCVAQWEVERAGLNTQIKQLTEELRAAKDRLRELQADSTDQRTRCNHLKMVNEQTERELRTTQDLLHQAEAELASALDRIHELNEETQRLQWEIKEVKQEKSCIKSNMARLDQEKDALLLKVDEKTEQNVRLEAELESRDNRIASLEEFIADLQKKLDVALDTAARSEHSSRQHTLETDRLRMELDKMERHRDNALKENSRLQDDLAALTHDHQQTSRSLECARREVDDLKLQLQGYVAEVRRITDILEEKEAERMMMLEQYRSLTVESANLETNNHSLESEARSTKSCLREAQTKIQDLEATLQEKKALVHGYEKQIKELTQQVAKMERKLESRSRAEHASRDLSRELETQKHCLTQKMDQLSEDNKQLADEVRCLRDEVSHLQSQLSKERKNSATLENVLASSRQETLQRTKDNSELKAQVQCLQGKLRDLHDKLEHGSEALRRCQTECADYKSQVAELHREVTNERFERARIEETRRSRPLRRPLKRATPRSLSLTSLRFSNMTPSYICPCCFLNRISSLRNSLDSSKGVANQTFDLAQAKTCRNIKFKSEFVGKYENPENISSDAFREALKIYNEEGKTCSEISTSLTGSSISTCRFDSGILSEDSEECMIPERLVNESEKIDSSETFNHRECSIKKSYILVNPIEPLDETEILAGKINYMLEEQKKFLKELDLPVSVEDGFKLEVGDNVELESEMSGDSEKQHKTIPKRESKNKSQTRKFDKSFKERIVFFASGDQDNVSKVEENKLSDKINDKSILIGNSGKEYTGKVKKPTVHFNDEPVKLAKKLKWETGTDLNKDYTLNKNMSVKMLFFPEQEIQCSNSSVDDSTSVSVTSSVYVTAASSSADVQQAVYTVAESVSNHFMSQSHNVFRQLNKID